MGLGFIQTTIVVVLLAIAYKQIQNLFIKTLPQAGGGYAAPGWRKVADTFRKYVDEGREKGGIFTVYHKGELVVEFWGGYADEGAKVKWGKEILGMFCSTTKVAGAVSLAMLADRGLLDYSLPVVKYWPEFGQNGKEGITVRQLLSHQAGLAIIDETFSMYDIQNDPEKIGQILAAQKPTWTPGEQYGYHGVTMGLFMDQLMRRIDTQHRSLSQFFQEEIAETFDIDFFVGLPPQENYRVARVEPADFLAWESLTATAYYSVLLAHLFQPNSYFSRSIINPPEFSEHLENNPTFREIPTPSSHGYGTGASMAKLLGILANGGYYGDEQLLSTDSIKRLSVVEATGSDVILLRNITFGVGTMIRSSPDGTHIFGHSGAGGQVGFSDPDNQLAWSYLTTHHSIFALGDSPKTLELEKVMYECLHDFNKEN